MLSKETIQVALSLLAQVSVKPTDSEADEQWAKARKAVVELREALSQAEQQIEATEENANS